MMSSGDFCMKGKLRERQEEKKMREKLLTTRNIVFMGMFSALAAVLMLFDYLAFGAVPREKKIYTENKIIIQENL